MVINPGEVHTGNAASRCVGWIYRMLYPDQLLQQATWKSEQQSEISYFAIAVIQDCHLARLILKLDHTLENANCTLEKDSRLLWTLA